MLFSLNSRVDIDEAMPHAEFWMGTHEFGPFFVLQSFNNKVLIGSDCVLSVSKALLIHAHPDKELVGFLHTTRLDVFKDDNHKPEMALALT
ncbi:Mannose-6-phosphate isomerase 1 [Camellia lanceoleosa]|uniref:Mannose-6-phosphate isomerase 1 n=1 Tax=Camellia lanceoleosa TaxID=1840588 RepID=A0ACC0J1U7_9ERIC|nr:Mannose-6-phosphate isomerase 1 [Camellia lanceoleosa]